MGRGHGHEAVLRALAADDEAVPPTQSLTDGGGEGEREGNVPLFLGGTNQLFFLR